ncbi:MAG: response regulator, partial [Myxococcota bacterium]
MAPQATREAKPLVLVIDPDESTRSVLEVALTRDGFDVWSAGTAAAGLTLLQGRLPDVIVLESDLGGQDGFTFVAQLRGDDRLAKLPVLLLAKADDENVEAMSDVVGVDDFLQKPAFARDVAAMVRLELARRESDGRGPLRFQAKVLPPVQLLRALMSCPRSGRLLLLDGRGEIRFRSGKVIDARIDGKGSTLDTVVRALALTRGEYSLVLGPIDGFAELQCGLRELVELVVPRLQKWTRALQRSLPLESRLAVDFGRLAQGLKAMPDEVNRIVQLFDGFRTVEQVLFDSSFSETLTLEVATRLYLMGVLTPAKGTEEELVVLRPMPRLFEPRATEQEELMRELFAGTAEVRAENTPALDDADWFAPLSHQTGLEVAEPDGGWTTAPVPRDLAEGLSPELARQLDAFQTPMRIEPQPVPEDVAAAQTFARAQPDTAVDTAMESALLRASDARPVVEIEREINAVLDEKALAQLDAQVAAHRADAKGRQARIDTPWMMPVVTATPATAFASAPTVEVAAHAAMAPVASPVSSAPAGALPAVAAVVPVVPA